MDRALMKFYLTDEAKQRGVTLHCPRELDAGFDLPSLYDVSIEPGGSALISTGVHLGIPENWVGLVRDRSSVARRGGVVAAGVIDASYRGEVKVVMYNLGKDDLVFKTGDRIAQCMVIAHLSGDSAKEAGSLEELGITLRGAGGFGSTGK